jgi:dihydroxy-acid dehydratase
MGGCDKTTPGLLMGAISMGIPCIYLPAGPMLRGNWKGKTLGSGSDAFKYWDERRAGNITATQWMEVETGIARSHGTCMVMGTAATMMGIAEAMGMTLPGASSIPAPDANHPRMAAGCGRRIVDMVWQDLTPARLLSRKNFENALTVAMAEGCSTNAIIHLVAISRRAGAACALTLDDFDAFSRKVPVIANIRPSGSEYLMEDFYYAGGLPALMNRIGAQLSLGELTVTGRSLGENIAASVVQDDEVIRPLDRPVSSSAALVVLRGNLAPEGAVMKGSAADARFFKHRGRALVFDSPPEMHAACADMDLDVDEDTVLVLRNAGPVGAPGMPEWGNLPIPKKLLERGVRDMVRLSDARMSGTHYGSCILHASPEAAVGGPLALVRTGDAIAIDVAARSITLCVPDDELALRRAAWQLPPRPVTRGYTRLYQEHVTQAHEGCDFDFLEGSATSPEPVIY